MNRLKLYSFKIVISQNRTGYETRGCQRNMKTKNECNWAKKKKQTHKKQRTNSQMQKRLYLSLVFAFDLAVNSPADVSEILKSILLSYYYRQSLLQGIHYCKYKIMNRLHTILRSDLETSISTNKYVRRFVVLWAVTLLRSWRWLPKCRRNPSSLYLTS